MDPLSAFFAKVFVYFSYKKDKYLFWRSQKYISSWGEASYGVPLINSYDKQSKLSVGNYVSIASGVTFLLGANHKLGYVTTYPVSRIDTNKIESDSNERGDITIGNDVWIGYGATLIGKVSVGDGAIIGAQALVVDDVPPYAVVGGVPAKIIKYRFNENQIEKLKGIAWWKWDRKTIQERQADIYNTNVDAFISKYE